MKSHHFQEAIKVFNQVLNCLESASSHSKNTFSDSCPTNPMTECHYLTGVCYFHLGVYEKVVQELTQVIGLDEEYRKNVYLFLGIAYKKLSMIEEALLVLGKALNLYPKYLDVLLLRAKILSKQKRFYDSVEDLHKCIKLDP
jgi:tetratricopeptide (TPR) repeat protein